jgi:hypothetical protein
LIAMEATRPKPAKAPTVLRWLALIELHGGHTAALESLIRQADELQRLKRAIRAMGLSPEILASEAHGADL